jgi:hypothetical protein
MELNQFIESLESKNFSSLNLFLLDYDSALAGIDGELSLKIFIKICFILFLFGLNIYLVFDSYKAKIIESSSLNIRIKNILLYGSSVASVIGTGLAIKSEIETQKLTVLQKELDLKNNLLAQTVSTLNKVQSELEQAEYKKYGVGILNIRMNNHFNSLQSSTQILLSKALELQALINNPDLTVLDKISKIRDFDTATFLFNRDLGEFKKLSDSLNLNLNSSAQASLDIQGGCAVKTGEIFKDGENFTSSPASSFYCSNNENKKQAAPLLEVEEIKQSNIINWDWFDSLNTWGKLAVSLLLTKSVLFASLMGLIFVYYGDVLLTKYNLESRYPKLAKIIKLRRKFSRYYFLLDCLLILGVILLEVCLSLYILFLTNF